MSIGLILKMIAAVATAATGVLALVKPTAVYGFTGLTAEGARGISEIRAIFGGLFIGLGAAPFIFGEAAYPVLGAGYLAIAVTRLASIIIDQSFASSNWISLGIEIVIAIILLVRF
jgi:hypothetical protein